MLFIASIIDYFAKDPGNKVKRGQALTVPPTLVCRSGKRAAQLRYCQHGRWFFTAHVWASLELITDSRPWWLITAC